MSFSSGDEKDMDSAADLFPDALQLFLVLRNDLLLFLQLLAKRPDLKTGSMAPKKAFQNVFSKNHFVMFGTERGPIPSYSVESLGRAPPGPFAGSGSGTGAAPLPSCRAGAEPAAAPSPNLSVAVG